MILSLDQMRETERALAAPLFAGLPGDAEISFEFFPPKSDKMEEQLWESVVTLAPLAPRFVSVTYGAGGSTRERTHATVARIIKETGIPAAAHLTCVEAAKLKSAKSPRPIGRRACGISSRCAGIRRQRESFSNPIRADMKAQQHWSRV